MLNMSMSKRQMKSDDQEYDECHVDRNIKKCRRLFDRRDGASPLSVLDIDSKEFYSKAYDPTYALQIWQSRRRLETEFLQSKLNEGLLTFVQYQPNLKDEDRCVLIDWMAGMAEENRMQTSTLFLAVAVLDVTLMKTAVIKKKFQLLGCVCLLIAGKLEEIQPPEIENLLYNTNQTFSAEELMLTEQAVLKNLDFSIPFATRHFFLQRLGKVAEFTEREMQFASFLLEISLQDFRFNYHMMSKIAAAAVHLTIQALRPRDSSPIWTPSLQHHSGGYSERDIEQAVLQLRKLHWDLEDTPYLNVALKYSKSKYDKVSFLPAVLATNLRFDFMSPALAPPPAATGAAAAGTGTASAHPSSSSTSTSTSYGVFVTPAVVSIFTVPADMHFPGKLASHDTFQQHQLTMSSSSGGAAAGAGVTVGASWGAPPVLAAPVPIYAAAAGGGGYNSSSNSSNASGRTASDMRDVSVSLDKPFDEARRRSSGYTAADATTVGTGGIRWCD